MVLKKDQGGKVAKSPRQQQQPLKAKKPPVAEPESDEDDESDTDDGDVGNARQQQLPKVVMPAGKKSPVAKQPQLAAKASPVKRQQQLMEIDDDDDEEEDDEDDSDEDPALTKPTAKNLAPVGKKQTPVAKQQTPVAKQQTPAGKKPQQKPAIDDDEEDDSDEEDEDDDEDDSEEEQALTKPVAKQQTPAAKKPQQQKPVLGDDEEDDSDEEDEDDQDEDEESEGEDEGPKKPVAAKKPQPPVAKAATNGAAAVPVAKATHYLLLGNLEAQSSVADLKNFLSRRGVAYVSAAIMDSPVAILGLSSQADAEAALAKCQGADYKNHQLAACQLAGRPDRLLQSRPLPGNTDSSKLFLSNLPAELNQTSLIALVKEKLGGRSDELVLARLLAKKGATAGVHRGQAIVELAGAPAAQTLLEGLSGHVIAGKPVRASYYVASAAAKADAASPPQQPAGKQKQAVEKQPQQQKSATAPAEKGASGRPELRGQTRTVLLLNLPADSCDDEASSIREAFPGGSRYSAKAKPGAGTGVCFVEFDTEQACSEAFDEFGKVGSFQSQEIGVTFVHQKQQQKPQHGGGDGSDRGSRPPSKTIGVFNLPFSITPDQLREHFADAQDLFIPRDHESGKSRGFGIVTFDSVEAATKAVSDNTDLSFDGRQARIEFREDRPAGSGGGRGGRGGFGDRGGRGDRGGFGDRGGRGGRGGFGGRGGRGGFGDRGGFGGRGGFGDRGGRGRGGRGSFGDRGGKRQSFGGDADDSATKRQKFDSDSD